MDEGSASDPTEAFADPTELAAPRLGTTAAAARLPRLHRATKRRPTECQLPRGRCRTSFSCSNSLFRGRASRSSPDSMLLLPGSVSSSMSAGASTSAALSDGPRNRWRSARSSRRRLSKGRPDDALTELAGVRLWHMNILSARHRQANSDAPIRAADPTDEPNMRSLGPGHTRASILHLLLARGCRLGRTIVSKPRR